MDAHQTRVAQVSHASAGIEAEFAAIVQYSEDAIIGMNLDGTIRSWNPAAQRLFDYQPGEVLGQSIDILVPVDYSHATPGLMQRIVRGEHIKHYETVRVRKDGTPIDVSLGLSPIKNASGAIVGISTIARDISERKQVERQQAAQHATTRILAEVTSLAEAAPKLLKVLGESLRCAVSVFWEPDQPAAALRCLEVWHRPRAEANQLATLIRQSRYEPGQGLPGRVWSSGKPAWVTDLTQAEQTPSALFAATIELRRALAFPVLQGNQVLGVIEFLDPDVPGGEPPLFAMLGSIGSQIGQFIGRQHTEARLRQTEDQFRHAQKMEAIGRLAGGIAHDFNNLLTAILGYSDLILSTLKPADTFHEELTEIRKAADRAAVLTRHLLAFSRKQVVSAKVLDLNTIIRDTQLMLNRLIGEDIKLVTNLAAELGKIKADPGQMEQVLLNLVVNARDAMPKGGQLTIETSIVQWDRTSTERPPEVAPGPYVQLLVRDTGCGMDEATRARIFEPYFTTKELGKGTGLGLATVYGIVKHGQGHITVTTQIDHGTTFRVYLPCADEIVHARKSYPGLHKAPGGQETILLVEDEEVVRTLARKTLQKCGYSVLEACQAEEAIQRVAQHPGPIHLLLSDVVMPGMGGGQLAERLLTLRPDLRVLYMSGYTDDAMVRHGVMEDEVAFLQKPFTPASLARRVREVLDQSG